MPGEVAPINSNRFIEILQVLGDVQGITIETDQDCLAARELLVRAARTLKAVEVERKQAAAPFNRIADQIYAAVRVVTDPLQTAVTLLKTRLADYSNRIEAERAAVAAKQALLPVPEGRLTPAILSMPEDRGPAPISTRTTTSVEVFDASLLPQRYLIPNLALIEADVRAGIEIPGCRVVSRTSVVAR
jgi:hypothetical protein